MKPLIAALLLAMTGAASAAFLTGESPPRYDGSTKKYCYYTDGTILTVGSSDMCPSSI